MKYSVVIPVYNSEKYLRQCIDSVLCQSHKDFEVILIDDGSTDSSHSICREYERLDNRIRLFVQENMGVSSARNRGIAECIGDYVIFLDSDDCINKRLLHFADEVICETEAELVLFGVSEEEFTDVDLLTNDYVNVSKSDLTNLQLAIINRDRQIFERDFIKAPSPCKIYKREVINKYHIRFSEKLHNGEDGIFNLYFMNVVNKVVFVRHKLLFYRAHDTSITHRYSSDAAEDFRELEKAYQEFMEQPYAEPFRIYMNERSIMSLFFCCMLDFCHNDNLKKYDERKKDFLKEYDYFSLNFNKLSLKSFGFKKKIVLFFIKHKLFFGVNILCKLQAKF